MPLSPLINGYDHLILDLDGCVWVGDQATPRAAEAVGAVRSAGMGVAFVTNDAQRTPEEYVRKLWSLGVQASVEDIVSVGTALQYVLAEEPDGIGTFVIGSDAVFRHVADAGCRILNDGERGGAGRDRRRRLPRGAQLRRAAHGDARAAVRRAAVLRLSGRDLPLQRWPLTGDRFDRGSARVRQRRPGDPGRQAGSEDVRLALHHLGPGRALVVGDRLDSDLAGAAAAGLDGAIVLTGVTDRLAAEAAEDPAPVAIAEDLGTLVLGA